MCTASSKCFSVKSRDASFTLQLGCDQLQFAHTKKILLLENKNCPSNHHNLPIEIISVHRNQKVLPQIEFTIVYQKWALNVPWNQRNNFWFNGYFFFWSGKNLLTFERYTSARLFLGNWLSPVDCHSIRFLHLGRSMLVWAWIFHGSPESYNFELGPFWSVS